MLNNFLLKNLSRLVVHRTVRAGTVVLAVSPTLSDNLTSVLSTCSIWTCHIDLVLIVMDVLCRSLTLRSLCFACRIHHLIEGEDNLVAHSA